MPTIHLPLATLDYTDEGDPTGTPVVFVHGFANTGELFAPTARALGERVRVLRPTLPLGAHRVPAKQPLGPGEVARTLLDFLDALDLQDVVLVGNDTGGAICQLALLQAPGRVRRMVLTNCDAFTSFPPTRLQPFRWFAKVPGLLTVALAPTRLRAVRHHAFFGLLSATRDDALWERFLAPWHADRAIRRDGQAFLRRASTQELLRATRALGSWGGELVVVWGTADRFFTERLGRRLAAEAGAPFVAVPGARTYLSLDAPEALADAVLRLAERRPAREPAAAT